MAKTKSQIVQSIVNDFRPEPYVKNIKCGFKPNDDGKVIISVEYTIDKKKLEGNSIDKKKVDRKSTRLNSSHIPLSRMPSSA